MTESECRERIRCAMSDRTGVLRFEGFDIVDAPRCAETAEKIRSYLVGRALAEVDAARIRRIGTEPDDPCARVVARMVAESQAIFVHGGRLSEGEAPSAPHGSAQRERV